MSILKIENGTTEPQQEFTQALKDLAGSGSFWAKNWSSKVFSLFLKAASVIADAESIEGTFLHVKLINNVQDQIDIVFDNARLQLHRELSASTPKARKGLRELRRAEEHIKTGKLTPKDFGEYVQRIMPLMEVNAKRQFSKLYEEFAQWKTPNMNLLNNAGFTISSLQAFHECRQPATRFPKWKDMVFSGLLDVLEEYGVERKKAEAQLQPLWQSVLKSPKELEFEKAAEERALQREINREIAKQNKPPKCEVIAEKPEVKVPYQLPENSLARKILDLSCDVREIKDPELNEKHNEQVMRARPIAKEILFLQQTLEIDNPAGKILLSDSVIKAVCDAMGVTLKKQAHPIDAFDEIKTILRQSPGFGEILQSVPLLAAAAIGGKNRNDNIAGLTIAYPAEAEDPNPLLSMVAENREAVSHMNLCAILEGKNFSHIISHYDRELKSFGSAICSAMIGERILQ